VQPEVQLHSGVHDHIARAQWRLATFAIDDNEQRRKERRYGSSDATSSVWTAMKARADTAL